MVTEYNNWAINFTHWLQQSIKATFGSAVQTVFVKSKNVQTLPYKISVYTQSRYSTGHLDPGTINILIRVIRAHSPGCVLQKDPLPLQLHEQLSTCYTNNNLIPDNFSKGKFYSTVQIHIYIVLHNPKLKYLYRGHYQTTDEHYSNY